MSMNRNLLQLLADGRCYSGSELGVKLGVSRAAVWKQINQWIEWGVPIVSEQSRGYQIPGGLQLLNHAEIQSALQPEVRSCIQELVLLDSVASTNDFAKSVLENAQLSGQFMDLHGCVYLAEAQTQGRGRSGRTWVSPYGQNIYGSLIWRFDQGIAQLAGLSLVLGLAVLETLSELGIQSSLKWPNDVLVEGKKIAGILVETFGDALGPFYVIIGVGMNIALSAEQGAAIEQPWTAIKQVMGENAVPNRNQMMGQLLNKIILSMQKFSQQGFTAFQTQWNQHDAFANQSVTMLMGHETISGIARGVREDGALRLQVGDLLRYISGGEMHRASLRSHQP